MYAVGDKIEILIKEARFKFKKPVRKATIKAINGRWLQIKFEDGRKGYFSFDLDDESFCIISHTKGPQETSITRAPLLPVKTWRSGRKR